MLNILLLLFILFLFVRTLCVEPFGVTTGSMAETIHGNRREVACPRCGAKLCVGSPDETRQSVNPQDSACCWNCGLDRLNLRELAPAEVFGDRLMVDKLVYRFRQPRRWEVAVFRCPVDDRKPYVKRVIGLPGERIRIFDGDVYANGVLLRKPLPVVREVAIPFFNMDHAPSPSGWDARWEVGPIAETEHLPGLQVPLPDVSSLLRQNALVLDALHSPFGLTYRHRDLDTGKDDRVRDRLTYNGGTARREWLPVHDFLFTAEVEVVAGGGALAIRLNDGADSAIANLPIQSSEAGYISRNNVAPHVFTTPVNLKPGGSYRVELAFVDRRITLAIDGKEVVPPLDVPAVELAKPGEPAGVRPGQNRPLQLGLRGASVILHHVQLSRDIHYRNTDSDCRNGTHGEYPLQADEYFMLGDNSASSSDSRVWEIAAVPRSFFLGKPFLIHQPLKQGWLPLLGPVQAVDWQRFKFME